MKSPDLNLGAILGTLLVAALCGLASAADVTFNWADFGLLTNRLSGKQTFITPTSNPQANGNFIISGDRKIYTNSGAANFTVTNMAVGGYKIELDGFYSRTVFSILVPDTNATLNANTLITSPTNLPAAGNVAWSSTVSDGRYVRQTNGTPTNITLNGSVQYRLENQYPASNGTNHVVDIGFARVHLVATNHVNFVQTTNRQAGVRPVEVIIDSNGASRNLAFNASWRWGPLIIPPASIDSGRILILRLTCYGLSETNVLASTETW
jgi:hypothetical protein